MALRDDRSGVDGQEPLVVTQHIAPQRMLDPAFIKCSRKLDEILRQLTDTSAETKTFAATLAAEIKRLHDEKPWRPFPNWFYDLAK